MYSNSNIYTVNIRRYFGSAEGMEELRTLISKFSCPRNPSIERFLKNNAINFTKQDTSVTYLVFSKGIGEFLGYFSLTIRPIEVPADRVSKSLGRRLERAGRFDRQANIYNAAAYLIAQLGKNTLTAQTKESQAVSFLVLRGTSSGKYSTMLQAQ